MKPVVHVIALSMLLAQGAFAVNVSPSGDFSYKPLSGIETVAVKLDGFYHELERYGVDPAAISRRVSDRLTQAGLRVVSVDAAISDPQAALVHVGLNTNYSYYWGYAYSLTLSIHDKQSVGNAGGSFVGNVIWSDGDIGVAQNSNLSYINGKIMSLVDQFISDHRAQHGV